MNIIEQFFTSDIATLTIPLLVAFVLLRSGVATVGELRQKLLSPIVPRGQAAL